jgi:hypothetical protein
MRLRVILSLMTMALACFTVAVWTAPLPADSRRDLPEDGLGDGDQLSI